MKTRTPKEVDLATNEETVQFFKQFGNCYVNKTYRGIEWFSRCRNKTSESTYSSQLYESTETAIKRLGIDLYELGATIHVKGWYSGTTCKHINAFVEHLTGEKRTLTKKDIENGKTI